MVTVSPAVSRGSPVSRTVDTLWREGLVGWKVGVTSMRVGGRKQYAKGHSYTIDQDVINSESSCFVKIKVMLSIPD